jgi:hypothetical protein
VARVRQGWHWLKAELQDDADTWQDRGIITSILYACFDAWLWCGSGIRLVIYVALAQLYLPDGINLDDIAAVQYSISPDVIEGVPAAVDANFRTATCVFGLVAIATLGVWPRLSFNTPASRLWIASQLWFLALDPVWGIWHHIRSGDDEASTHPAWRPITHAGED